MTHALKTIAPYFDKVWHHEKNFEVRYNDRDFQKGDNVLLREYNDETKEYSGRELYCTITYVLSGYYAIKDGYVVFGLSIEKWID